MRGIMENGKTIGTRKALTMLLFVAFNSIIASVFVTAEGNATSANTLYNVIAGKTNGLDANIDFSQPSSESNGDGVNTLSSTASNKYPVYYFRGNVKDNHIIFADYCWRIVRTTSTGGVKIIYNGVPDENNKCPDTLSDGWGITDLGRSPFNSLYHSPAYAGYMYGDVYTTTQFRITPKMIFANDVQWDGEKYTLLDTYRVEYSSSSWTSGEYDTLAKRYHYTCISEDNNCNSVYYMNYIAASGQPRAIELKDGENIEDAKQKMFKNENDSAIKQYIDNWYSENLVNYTDRIEDTVWCNDRSIYTGLLKSKDDEDLSGINSIYGTGGNKEHYSHFSAEERNFISFKPQVACPQRNDAFTVDEKMEMVL
jgi:hypothetical protein